MSGCEADRGEDSPPAADAQPKVRIHKKPLKRELDAVVELSAFASAGE